MKIAIITGGTGPERNTSINSAKYIQSNITFAESETFLYPEDYPVFLEQVNDIDVVIPMVHGYGGEDGTIQKDLEQKGIKYIFSKPDVDGGLIGGASLKAGDFFAIVNAI